MAHLRSIRIYYSDRFDSTRYAVDVTVDPGARPVIRVGRSGRNEVVLPSPQVPELAATLELHNEHWVVRPADALCHLDGLGLAPDRLAAIGPRQQLRIAHYTIELDDLSEEEGTPGPQELDRLAAELVDRVHRELLPRIPGDLIPAPRADRDRIQLEIEHTIQELASLALEDQPAVGIHLAGRAIRDAILDRAIREPDAAAGRSERPFWSAMVSEVPEFERSMVRIVEVFAARLGLATPKVPGNALALVDAGFGKLWDRFAATKLDAALARYLALRSLKKEIKDLVFGFGPLEDLLRSPAISEIMVNDSQHIYIESDQVLRASGRRFVSDAVTQAIIERIVGRMGRRIDRANPMVDARMPDGSRVNAVLPPLAVNGPCLTIRKFPQRDYDLARLVGQGDLSASARRFLAAAVECRYNVIVSGGTGSGKTTMLNCLSDCLPDDQRVVTIEDVAELRLRHDHQVRLETRDRNLEGQGAYTIRDLVRNALRMRPDRLIVGECRGAEALDMLQAMNTGHDGSLTTIHANSPADVVSRLEVMVLMAVSLPVEAIQRQIASGVDIIVHLERLDGHRRVTSLTELAGFDRQTRTIRQRTLYAWNRHAGRLEPTGALPSFIDVLIDRAGLDLEVFFEEAPPKASVIA